MPTSPLPRQLLAEVREDSPSSQSYVLPPAARFQLSAAGIDHHVHECGLGEHVVPEGFRAIPLTRGYMTIVDAADYDLVSRFKWYARIERSGIYAARNEYQPGGSRARQRVRCIYLHSFLCPAPAGGVTDHRSGDTLDNRRTNLRASDRRGNARNRKVHRTSKSGIKGVFQQNGRWRARIFDGSKTISLGYFETAEEAGLAYDRAATRLYGEFARLNFPGPSQQSALGSHGTDIAGGEPACVGEEIPA